MYHKIALGALALTVAFTACKKDEATKQKIDYSTLTISSDYNKTFVDESGATAVNRSLPTGLRSMLSELDGYIKTGTTINLADATLQNLFNNTGNPFADATLNGADYNIAAYTGKDMPGNVKAHFTDLMSEVAAIDNSVTATPGTAGVLTVGTKKYLLNRNGGEDAQFIQKGLIGAMLFNQIRVLTNSNANNSANLPSKNYTALAHDWDMALGYLTSNEVFPKKDPVDDSKFLENYLGGYVRQVGYSEGLPQDIYLAFLKGRAAIVNNDMTMLKTQRDYINQNIEKALATVCISYMNKTKTATDAGARAHALSEGYGFLYALRFAPNAKVSATLSDNLLAQLVAKPNGFYDLTNDDIDAVRNQLATATGIDKETVVNH